MTNNVGSEGDPLATTGNDGTLFRIAPHGAVTTWKNGIGISNPDGRTFYFGDTLANCIWAYDYDPLSGDISNERDHFSDFERGLPDGSAIDSQGYLWNCRYYGGYVVRVSPRGTVDRIVEVPTRNPTTAVFGGAANRTLFVTSASNEKAWRVTVSRVRSGHMRRIRPGCPKSGEGDMTRISPASVLVTSASGNLGGKLLDHLVEAPWCNHVIALVEPGQSCRSSAADLVECELNSNCTNQLADVLAGVNAVVHLAAQRPYSDATWADASVSLGMTLKVLDAGRSAGVKRVVFASSNHVMRRYKYMDEAGVPGSLIPETPPLRGTFVISPDGSVTDAAANASVRLMGERACAHFAEFSNGTLTSVSLRIGWCQPDENCPESISSTGLPCRDEDEEDPQVAHDMRWFRTMWLSNDDFLQVMDCAITASPRSWTSPSIAVNAVSGNSGMPWNLARHVN